MILVRVTQAHIELGENNHMRCPIALALTELGHTEVSVGIDSAVIGSLVYPLPLEACRFVEQFDRDYGLPSDGLFTRLHQFEFTLEQPEWDES